MVSKKESRLSRLYEQLRHQAGIDKLPDWE